MKNLKHINEFLKIYEKNSKPLFVDESNMKSILVDDNDFAKGDIVQAFFNIVYSKCEGNIQCVEKYLGKLPLFIELFGNYDGQVNNGGHQQYFDNGYASSTTGGFGSNHTEIDQHEEFIGLFKELGMITILGKKVYNIINEFEIEETENDSCYSCDGQGKVECEECDGMGRIDCPECDGEGEDDEGNACSNCSGNGHVDCEECEGEGDLYCHDCDGSGEVEGSNHNEKWDELDNRWYDLENTIMDKLNKYLKTLTLDGEKITDLIKISSEQQKYNL